MLLRGCLSVTGLAEKWRVGVDAYGCCCLCRRDHVFVKFETLRDKQIRVRHIFFLAQLNGLRLFQH